MSNNNVGVAEFLEDNYLEYGKFVNFHRMIPGSDGLKKVYRRSLIGLKNVANGKLVSTNNVVGEISTIHVFGESSIESVVGELARVGAIKGKGSFGVKLMEDIPAAAKRYTQCGLTEDQANYYFSLLKYSPLVEGEVEEEPEYLIFPVPFQLVYSGFNFGLGIKGVTPGFTYDSLIEAYYSDDYNKLKSNYGYKINKDESSLKDLWEIGFGTLSLSMDVERLDKDEILIKGSGEIFKPAVSKFRKLESEGRLIITNESSDEIVLRVSRAKRISLDMDEVYKTCKSISTKSRVYNILAVVNNKIQRMPIRDWLDLTITRYKKYFEQSKADRIERCEYNIKLYTLLPEVASRLIENRSDIEIIKSVKGLDSDMLADIKKKPISMIRRSDFERDINQLNKKIESIKKEDADTSIKSYGKIFGE